ncbi:RWD domain-containing protein 1-like [Montipora foliosa]|uniref:RWD domain-containing protein 1-like n=1 Tax=Montipora foliosa TaxID=591990 RepID=UPI0035F17484
MTDHKEEQELELEALTSIYPDEFSLIESDPCCFQVSIACEPEKPEDEDCKVCVTLQFTYVETYPDDPPTIEVTSYEGIDDSDVLKLQEFLDQEALENLGMAMVFTLVSSTQEKLNEFITKLKDKKENEKLTKEKEAEEAERKKFTGTPVTLETFVVWRRAFELEMMQINKKTNEGNLKGKLTGRQLFEQDESMENSDVVFLEDEVKVDESLFQELDDLDLDGEDLE